MIFPRLLSLDSSDINHLPADPACCLVAVTARIGQAGADAGDYFQFTVGTPAGLAEENYSGWGKALLVLPEFSWPAVERAVERLLAQCAGPSWEAVTTKLATHLNWEYEGYRPVGG